MMWGNNWMGGMWGDHRVWWFLGPLALLDLLLRGFALWRSARSGQQVWFIALLIVNSVGILPAIYLLMNRETSKKASKKK